MNTRMLERPVLPARPLDPPRELLTELGGAVNAPEGYRPLYDRLAKARMASFSDLGHGAFELVLHHVEKPDERLRLTRRDPGPRLKDRLAGLGWDLVATLAGENEHTDAFTLLDKGTLRAQGAMVPMGW